MMVIMGPTCTSLLLRVKAVQQQGTCEPTSGPARARTTSETGVPAHKMMGAGPVPEALRPTQLAGSLVCGAQFASHAQMYTHTKQRCTPSRSVSTAGVGANVLCAKGVGLHPL